MVRFGLGAYVGFGDLPFLTDGAAADIKSWFRVFEEFDGIQLERVILDMDDLSTYDKQVATLYPGHRQVSGQIVLRATYDHLQYLLRHLTGHNVTATGTSPYVWTFGPIEPNSGSHYVYSGAGRGFCIEVYRGHSANSVFYQGCLINEWSMKFEPGSHVELTLGFVGRGHTIGAKSTPAFNAEFITTPTGQALAGATAFVQLPSGTPRIARSASISIRNAIELRRDVSSIEPLMSYPQGKREVMLECEVETDDDTFLTQLNDPRGSRFASGTLYLADAVTATRQLAFNFNELALQSPAESRVRNLGVITCALKLVAYRDTSNPAITSIQLQNGQNTYPT
ncbi:MAG: hypothetical protein IT458_05045 [Planctomycetes bacterium]|nr:hypothetical protein [Planctomycetota bacterium]